MDIALLQIITDTGMCVLIWMVQLVIYPSFCYFSEAGIKKWHPIYTHRITGIVLPLMVGQMAAYLYAFFAEPSPYAAGMLFLVIATWLITFLSAVPLHHALDGAANSSEIRKKLVEVNWIRTGLWTLIFCISLLGRAY